MKAMSWTRQLQKVEYNKNDPKEGALVTISNLGRMAMPVVVEYTTVSGQTSQEKISR